MAKTIMIVDDSASMRQVIGIALKDAGYELIEAGDGNEALKKLDGAKIHLIISDINMPNMDGISFVREVKQIHPHHHADDRSQPGEKGRRQGSWGESMGQ
jgi:two-component system, chemotaxis family, chemotaxis protein CheY